MNTLDMELKEQIFDPYGEKGRRMTPNLLLRELVPIDQNDKRKEMIDLQKKEEL